MERDAQGRICLDESEAAIVRAALFVAVFHQNDVSGHCADCFRTITGVEQQSLVPTLDALDELNGHNTRVDAWLAEEFERKAGMSDAELNSLSERVRESFLAMVRRASERDVPVPVGFLDRLMRSLPGDR